MPGLEKTETSKIEITAVGRGETKSGKKNKPSNRDGKSQKEARWFRGLGAGHPNFPSLGRNDLPE